MITIYETTLHMRPFIDIEIYNLQQWIKPIQLIYSYNRPRNDKYKTI